jgi:hypothetical protein
MTLPDDWRIATTAIGLQLVPPDAHANAQGPTELYVVAAQPAPGVARADDPRVVAYVDNSLRALVPTLGPASAPAACGPGIALRWHGRAPLTGAELLAIAMLQLVDDAVASLVALGERAHVEARLATLEAIFGSFGTGEGQRDPALAGTWHHWSYRSTGLYTSSSISSESRRVVQLAADGSASERSSHEGIGSVHAASYHGGYVGETSGGRVGTWTAGDGVLYVRWSDGAALAWRYQVDGAPGNRRLLLFVDGDRKPMEWTERPIVV